MKKEYIKPVVFSVTLLSGRILGENSGVADKPMAKTADAEIEEEKVETGIPTAFTSIWGEDEED